MIELEDGSSAGGDGRDRLVLMPLGACLLRGPLNHVKVHSGSIGYPRFKFPGTYTLGETIQIVDYLCGDKDIPADVKPLAGIGEAMVPIGRERVFADIDVALVELGSQVEVILNGCNVNRAYLANAFAPVREASVEGRRALNRWYQQGLMNMNDDARAEAATALIEWLDESDLAEAGQLTAYVRGARSEPTDVRAKLAELAEKLPVPLGVVTYVFRFMPDGRVISWPPEFYDAVLEAARSLGIPYFEPYKLVLEHGVTEAMKDDLRHYRDEFSPLVGKHIVAFARGLSAGR
jgi:hypothetical protein